MKLALQIAGLVALIGAAILFAELSSLAFRTEQNEAAITAEILSLNHSLLNDTAQIAAAAKVVSQLGAQERNAFTAQQEYYVKLTSDTDTLLRSANDSIVNFNRTVLPQTSDLLVSSRNAIDDTSTSVRGIARQAEQALSDASVSLSDTDLQIRKLDGPIADFSETLQRVDATSANLVTITEDGRKVADYYTASIMKPVRKVEVVAHVIIRGVGWFLGF